MRKSLKETFRITAARPPQPEARRSIRMLDRLIPAEFFLDPDLTRRARLVANFGLLGALFGVAYSVFYILIEHQWGALIILICSSLYAASPSVMRYKHSVVAYRKSPPLHVRVRFCQSLHCRRRFAGPRGGVAGHCAAVCLFVHGRKGCDWLGDQRRAGDGGVSGCQSDGH